MYRLVLPLALIVAAPVCAQVKLGIVDLQKAILGTAEIKKAQSDLEAKFKPRQDAAAKLDRELQSIQQQLQTMAGKLTPQAEADLQAQGARKQRDLQRLTEDLQADVDRERNDILQKAGRQMTEVLKKLAESKGLDVVLDRATTLYAKDALEVTTDAIAAYDAAHPAK
ncbi:MAG: OmpH family outer membrane protein [Bryobacteraceae bacterium]|jgi:outer membrane protein|nr:OmpH family outer membrane protein [Bryobacteraceae bacterium]